MSLPFSVLKSLVGDKVQDTSTTLTRKIGDYINRFYEQLWNSYNWREVTVIDEELTLTSGKSQQVMPRRCSQILAISSRELNAVLSPSSPFVYQQKYLSTLASQSAPIGYVEAGRSPVAVNLSTASKIEVVSSDDADVHKIRVRGYTGDDLERTESITIAGSAATEGQLTFKANGLIDVSSAQKSSGIITIREFATGNVLDKISPEDYKNEYLTIVMNSPLDSARVVYISYKKRFVPLVYDEDCPRFSCHNALILYAVAQVHKTRKKYSQAQVEEAKASSLISSLVTEKEVLGLELEQTIPMVSSTTDDLPYFSRY